MPLRERMRRAFGRKSSPSPDEALTPKRTKSQKANLYRPGDPMPRPKYPGRYDKEHQEELRSYSFKRAAAAFATRRKSSAADVSPGGSTVPSRRNSGLGGAMRRSGVGQRPGAGAGGGGGGLSTVVNADEEGEDVTLREGKTVSLEMARMELMLDLGPYTASATSTSARPGAGFARADPGWREPAAQTQDKTGADKANGATDIDRARNLANSKDGSVPGAGTRRKMTATP